MVLQEFTKPGRAVVKKLSALPWVPDMRKAANKIPGIRAAVVQDVEHARLAREHNNANVLCLGGRFTALGLAAEMLQVWYKGECNGERHHRRLDKIASLESAPVSERQASGE